MAAATPLESQSRKPTPAPESKTPTEKELQLKREETVRPVSTPKQSEPPPVQRGPISGGVLNGKAIHLAKPAYPAIARSAHAEGIVMVQVLIDENGDVVSAHAVSGHPLLQASAVAAARASKFSPTKLGGQPVKVSGVITYNFVSQ